MKYSERQQVSGASRRSSLPNDKTGAPSTATRSRTCSAPDDIVNDSTHRTRVALENTRPRFLLRRGCIDDVPELTYSFDVKELPRVHLTGMGEPVHVASVACLLVVSREVIINDDAGVIAAGVRAFASQAASREAEMGFGLFSTNPNMSDGSAWPSAGAGSLLTRTDLDSDGLATALAALRDQQTESGTKSDADAATLGSTVPTKWPRCRSWTPCSTQIRRPRSSPPHTYRRRVGL